MNRAVAIALSFLCFSVATQAPAGYAQVSEDPAVKQERIDKFQDRRLIFEEKTEEGVTTYTLRQGPDTIYDADFVELLNDQSLTDFWFGQRNRDWAYWLGSGAVAVPAGGLLFLNNFQAKGPLAFFTQTDQAKAASDWRTFALGAAGLTLVAYGAYNVSQWLLETLDVSHPNRLDKDSIQPRVTEWNDQLRERLNLDVADIPSPPPPRPSPSPTESPSPGADNTDTGLDQGQLGTTPSPPVSGPDSYPAGTPPSPLGAPLPVISPGALPALPSPTPAARPSEYWFPGFPKSSPTPSTAPKATPSPTPSGS